MIKMSTTIDQLSTYDKSRRTDLSQDKSDRPLTCHKPVTPGLTSSLRCTSLSYASTSRLNSGRGPTTLISCRSTLMNCGSSSMLKRRNTRPTGVTRGSSRILKRRPSLSLLPRRLSSCLSASCDHGAELQHRKGPAVDSDALRGVEDWAPTVDLIAMAAARRIGRVPARAANAKQMSKARF